MTVYRIKSSTKILAGDYSKIKRVFILSNEILKKNFMANPSSARTPQIYRLPPEVPKANHGDQNDSPAKIIDPFSER